jgi:hypothetical protein
MKEVQTKSNVKFKIMPFGYITIEVKCHEEGEKAKEKEFPVYHVPKTTG